MIIILTTSFYELSNEAALVHSTALLLGTPLPHALYLKAHIEKYANIHEWGDFFAKWFRISPVTRALILLWLSEFFCISEFVFAFQKTQVIFVQIKITSMQNVQLDKTNILLSCLLINITWVPGKFNYKNELRPWINLIQGPMYKAVQARYPAYFTIADRCALHHHDTANLNHWQYHPYLDHHDLPRGSRCRPQSPGACGSRAPAVQQ